MAGSRQHLTCSFMRACLRCLHSGRHERTTACTCCRCCYGAVAAFAVGYRVATTAALVLEETVKKHIRRENENTEVQKKCRKQRKAGKVQRVIDSGGVQVGACERPGRCQPTPLTLRKKSKSITMVTGRSVERWMELHVGWNIWNQCCTKYWYY